MSSALSLADVLGGHVVVEWYEAVALVREVADRLLGHPGPVVPVPELNQIYLSPEGHVDLAGGKASDEPVRRLGQLLLALVANSEAPIQMRLVISKATASPPGYPSIEQYSDALAFFERPERSTVLQALAARAGNASTPGTERPPTLDSLAPLPKAEEVEAKPRRQASNASRARSFRFFAIAAVVLLIAGAGTWYAWKTGVGPRNQAEASVLADQTGDKVGSALITGASAVTERLGLGRIVPAADAVAPLAAQPAPDPAAVPSTPPRKPANLPQSDVSVPPLVAYDLEVPGRGYVSPVASTETPASDLSEPATPADPNVYTIASAGITPPVGLRIQLARELPPDLDPHRLGRIDLIIAVDGSVESAKLVGPPRTIHDGLFLSVAKAWTFQPAVKDGAPVRYLKTIWIATP